MTYDEQQAHEEVDSMVQHMPSETRRLTCGRHTFHLLARTNYRDTGHSCLRELFVRLPKLEAIGYLDAVEGRDDDPNATLLTVWLVPAYEAETRAWLDERAAARAAGKDVS